jgi:hypothetical protein
MKYTTVKTPKWSNAANTQIQCEVDFNDLAEEFVSFTAVAFGDYPHTHEIFARCVAGEFGPVAGYVPPADITGETALNKVRSKRDDILKTEVDPIVSNPLRWADLSEAQQQAWANYRRALLDITTTYPTPSYVWNEASQRYDEVDVTWPVKPE